MCTPIAPSAAALCLSTMARTSPRRLWMAMSWTIHDISGKLPAVGWLTVYADSMSTRCDSTKSSFTFGASPSM